MKNATCSKFGGTPDWVLVHLEPERDPREGYRDGSGDLNGSSEGGYNQKGLFPERNKRQKAMPYSDF